MLEDGLPVIIFPKDSKEVKIGKPYLFFHEMTQDATLTLEGIEYRVAYATCLNRITKRNASLHEQTMSEIPPAQVTAPHRLANRLPGASLSALQNLKAQLSAK